MHGRDNLLKGGLSVQYNKSEASLLAMFLAWDHQLYPWQSCWSGPQFFVLASNLLNVLPIHWSGFQFWSSFQTANLASNLLVWPPICWSSFWYIDPASDQLILPSIWWSSFQSIDLASNLLIFTVLSLAMQGKLFATCWKTFSKFSILS